MFGSFKFVQPREGRELLASGRFVPTVGVAVDGIAVSGTGVVVGAEVCVAVGGSGVGEGEGTAVVEGTGEEVGGGTVAVGWTAGVAVGVTTKAACSGEQAEKTRVRRINKSTRRERAMLKPPLASCFVHYSKGRYPKKGINPMNIVLFVFIKAR